MREPNDLELEALLAELAADPLERELIREEHRQLEKDLLRLADPPPPPDFLASVMLRVAHAPPAPLSRRDVWAAVVTVMGALALALAALVVSGAYGGSFGLALGSAAVKLRESMVASGSVLTALWTTAALPLAIGVSVVLAASLSAFRRFVQPEQTKVVSP
jgi:hypothetical protein